MPTVPIYDNLQVGQTQLPGNRFSMGAPDTTGIQQQARMGEAIQGAGSMIGKIMIAEQEKADKVRIDAAATEAYKAATDIMVQGQQRLGEDALLPDADGLGLADGGLKAFQLTTDKIRGGLGNDRQRAMFDQALGGMQRSIYGKLTEHQAKQQQVFTVATAESQGAAADERGALYYNDPAEVERAKAIKMDAVRTKLAASGIHDENSPIYKQGMLEGSSQFHGGVIDGMVANDQFAAANEYYKANSTEMTDKTRVAALKLIEGAGIKDESLRLSMTLTGSEKEQKRVLGEMFKEGKITAGVHDATVARVEHDFAQLEHDRNENNKAAMGAVQDWIINNPGKPITDLPNNLYAWAKSEGHLAALDGFATRSGRPVNQATALAIRGGMMETAIRDPEAFIKEYRDTGFANRMDLGAEGIKEMQNIAIAMLTNSGKYKFSLNSKYVQNAIPKGLLKPANKDKKDAFVALMFQAGDEWRKANPGKEPTQADIAQMAAQANGDFIRIGESFWQSKNVKAVDAVAGGEVNAVPERFYNEMRARGASEEEILAAWRLRQGEF
jgi:hypothetical protein